MNDLHPTTFDYLQPTPDQIETMKVIRTGFRNLADTLTKMIPDGRYKSLTITALEEAAMWANKGVTRCSNGGPRAPLYTTRKVRQESTLKAAIIEQAKRP